MSNKMFELIRHYTPDLEKLSIDECFIDYAKIQRLYGDPIKFAYHLKNEICHKLGFTVNIGIANNKLCAKMASDFKKPNRVHTLFDEEIKVKMWPLDVGSLYGVGKKSTEKLKSLNINTIGDLAQTNSEYLYKYFKNQSQLLIDKANGIDLSEVNPIVLERKGISNSATFSYNLIRLEDILTKLQALTENVCLVLRKDNKYAQVVSVTLRDKTFKNKCHQRKLKNATDDTDYIYNVAKDLVVEMWNEEPIRLIGISLNNLTNNVHHQLSLFEDYQDKEKNDKLNKVIDELKLQYGNKIIYKASLNSTNIKIKD